MSWAQDVALDHLNTALILIGIAIDIAVTLRIERRRRREARQPATATPPVVNVSIVDRKPPGETRP